MNPNTLFLRLEGALQAWGDNQSKFLIRRTAEAPTKSGVIGLLCAAMGISRIDAANDWLVWFSELNMGTRIDRPGVRWWDYHTVGAGLKMQIAEGEGKSKPRAMITRREFLCDASFIVVLQGNPDLITELEGALLNPTWTSYLGRKCCPPSRPIFEKDALGEFSDVKSALRSISWKKRLRSDTAPKSVECLLDWIKTEKQPEAPLDAEIWYDVPLSFEPPSHSPRFVIRKRLEVGKDGEIDKVDKPLQSNTLAPPRPRADYSNSKYRKRREERLILDHHLCIFCKNPGNTVQHITYRHAGGEESVDELRALCRLCHDAVTMIEYGHGMGLDRIDPEDPFWRNQIIQKRKEIIEFRSLETRRRRLNQEDVE